MKRKAKPEGEKMTPVLVTMPPDLLEQIKQAAKAQDLKVSQWLRKCARKNLGLHGEHSKAA